MDEESPAPAGLDIKGEVLHPTSASPIHIEAGTTKFRTPFRRKVRM